MRASKEQADKLARIAFEEVEEFINSAKRRLPTEAAIERDRNRKR